MYVIRQGDPMIRDLKELDRAILYSVRKCSSLPHSGTPLHYIYGSVSKGGLGILSLEEEYHFQSVNMLNRQMYSPDKNVRKFFRNMIQHASKKWLFRSGPNVSLEDVIGILNSRNDGKFYSKIANTESHGPLLRLRRSVRFFKHLKKGFKIFEFLFENGEILLKISTVKGEESTLHMKQRNVYRILRKLLQENHIERLSDDYPLMGKSIEAVSASPQSSSFNKRGHGITFSGYRFIHRARLQLQHVRDSPIWKKKEMIYRNKKELSEEDLMCRKCHQHLETMAHVQCFCQYNLTDMQKRHDAILKRVVKAMPTEPSVEIRVNQVLGQRQKRPDIVKIDSVKKRAAIVDIACTFETSLNSLEKAHSAKIEKYQEEASFLEAQSFKVYRGAIIVGTLGSWYLKNEKAMRALGIYKPIQKRILPYIIGETIENSKTIYWRHILGDRYVLPRNMYNQPKENKSQ
jgi:hypothetical protein